MRPETRGEIHAVESWRDVFSVDVAVNELQQKVVVAEGLRRLQLTQLEVRP